MCRQLHLYLLSTRCLHKYHLSWCRPCGNCHCEGESLLSSALLLLLLLLCIFAVELLLQLPRHLRVRSRHRLMFRNPKRLRSLDEQITTTVPLALAAGRSVARVSSVR